MISRRTVNKRKTFNKIAIIQLTSSVDLRIHSILISGQSISATRGSFRVRTHFRLIDGCLILRFSRINADWITHPGVPNALSPFPLSPFRPNDLWPSAIHHPLSAGFFHSMPSMSTHSRALRCRALQRVSKAARRRIELIKLINRWYVYLHLMKLTKIAILSKRSSANLQVLVKI